jgi:Ca-activated chloride channel family protein
MRHKGALATALFLAVIGLLGGCGPRQPDFTIVSGSENEVLQPIVQRFCRQHHIRCVMRFEGSLDIGQSLRPGQTLNADAVWPASSVWIDLYDTGRRVRDQQSIYQSPVILGVRLSKARELGWIGRPVHMSDILQAVQAGRLSFLMTSATQSNSGAAAYLAMLSSAVGSTDQLTTAQLSDPRVTQFTQSMLHGVARSAGSSGWLGELYTRTANEGRPYDAMWNYEAVIHETNAALRRNHLEPLYAIYPVEGSSVADGPLGYVSHGQPAATEQTFRDLQAYLLSRDVQAQIATLGRRIPLGRAPPAAPDPSWNFDPRRLVTSISPPEPEVIRSALNLYQETLRRPSLTAICLDFSGSMEGKGEQELRAAMGFLFTPARTREVLVQWSQRDHVYIIPFSDHVLATVEGSGSDVDQSTILQDVSARSPDGGTNMYACGQRALELMHDRLGSGDYLPAIVMMTDGRSDDGMAQFIDQWRSEGHDIPVFGITFGDADVRQLNDLAERTHGRVFNGGDNLAEAFRAVRGYN